MSKPGADPSSGISSVDVLIPTERHPACRQREARPGSCTERENLAGDAKGKSTSGSNREAESTDAPERGGLPRSSDEVGQCPWSEGGGSSSLSAGQLGRLGRADHLRGARMRGRCSPDCMSVSPRGCSWAWHIINNSVELDRAE